MMNKLLAYLLLVFLFAACGSPLEVRETTDEIGFRQEFEVDADGVKQGFLREYDPEGHLLVEERYTDGELNGPRKVFHASGQVLAEENIVRGRYTGEHRSYRDDGSLDMRGVYTNGAMNGIWYTFHPNGSVKAELTFRDNLQHGPLRQWYPDGKPELSGYYADGDDYEGPLIRYDSTGSLERVLNCKVKAGCRTFWTPDSTANMPVAEVDMTRPDGR